MNFSKFFVNANSFIPWAKRQAAMDFVKQGPASFGYDVNSTEDMQKWLWQFSTEKVSDDMGTTFGYKGWAEVFKEDFEKWLLDSEKYKSEIQAFYLSLVDFDTEYYKAVKSHANLQKQVFDERWEASGKGRVYSNISKEIEMESSRQKMTGADQGTSFAQMSGFAQIGRCLVRLMAMDVLQRRASRCQSFRCTRGSRI